MFNTQKSEQTTAGVREQRTKNKATMIVIRLWLEPQQNGIIMSKHFTSNPRIPPRDKRHSWR